MSGIGSTVSLAVSVTDADGAATDAETVVLTLTLPDGTSATPTVTNPPSTTGAYRYDYVPTMAGRHVARWLFTDPNAEIVDVFHVEPTDPGFIVSLAEAKAHLNKTATVDDDEIRTFIAAATDVIENDPEIGVGPVVVRSYTERKDSGAVLILNRVPVVSLTSVAPYLTTGTTYDVADLTVDEATGVVELSGGGCISGGPFAVTYKAGRAVVPPNIRLAALELIKHWWESQRGTTARAQLADPTITLASGYAIPTRVAQLLRAHRSVIGFA